MLYVEVQEMNRLSSFYLAMEEYIARYLNTNEDCFFMWQVPATVMVGRNQLINNEVNLSYCHENNIHVLRRKSGGGCIYVDKSCLLFSYITHDEQVNLVFSQYINLIVEMLNKMGIAANAGGRNDVMIEDKKISGNAFYHVPGRSIVHGTMLYDTDMENMVKSITPSEEKLISKGVESVRQHIALLKDFTTLSLEQFKQLTKQHLCSSKLVLTTDDVKGIEKIEKDYLSDNFTFGNNPRYSISNKKHFDNVGNMEVYIQLKNDVIKHINILGDYFLTGDIDNQVLKPLQNIQYNEYEITAALPENIGDIVRNLRKDQLIELIMAHP